MNKPEKKEQTSLPPVRILIARSLVLCVMGATEDDSAISAGAARRTLGKRKEPRCMG